MRTFLTCLLAVLVGRVALAQPAAHTEPELVPTTGRMPEFIRRYETQRGALARFYDLGWSELRLEQIDRADKAYADALAAMDFASMDQDNKVDAVLLKHFLEVDRARNDLARRQLADLSDLLPFRGTVQTLLTGMWSMQPMDAEAAAGSLSGLPEAIKKLRERVEQGRKAEAEKPATDKAPDKASGDAPKADAAPGPIKTTPVVAKRAASAASAIRWQLQQWYDFYAGYTPEFSWWTRKPFEQAVGAIDDYAKYLREEIAGQKGTDDDPLVGEAIGEAALQAELRAEMLPYSPRQLIAIGDRELAWCQEELKKASREMGLGDDWKAALAKVKADHVPPGKQDELAAEYAKAVIAWVKEKDLVTIPPECEETWRLKMITPQQQRIWPFAVYFGQSMGVSYPTDDMKHEDKLMSMRGNNRHFMRIVTPHELIPGHHLQGYLEQRVRPYRQMFSTPFLVEGWALQWEMLLWDLGYPLTPEDRIGMLFWRMHRCARITVSLRFHLGEMTPAQMIDYLVDTVGHERFGATSEVRRYIGGDYSPLYQCGYMIGGLQLRALGAEAIGEGKMTRRQFSDAVLRQGPIPIELIRAAMLGTPLTPDGPSTWKFAGEVAVP